MNDKYDFITSIFNVKEDQIDSYSLISSESHITLKIKLKNSNPECPYCGGKSRVKGYKTRVFKHLSISSKSSSIEWNRRFHQCVDCGKTFGEPNPFGPENYSASYALLFGIAKDLKNIHLSFFDIAQKNNVSSSTVSLYADSFLKVPRLSLPENLGIDEIHSDMAKYGGAYLCVLVDNDNRCLIDILPNRSKNTLSKYFHQISLDERKRVKFVTMDMWDPYEAVANTFLPNCEVAVDPFHIVENLNKAFSELRVNIQNQVVYNSPAYYLLKHWHYLLDSDHDLDNEPKYNPVFKQKLNYRDIYNMLLSISEDLTLAYNLKERYREFNRVATPDDAAERLNQIIEEFEAADLPCYQSFIAMLKKWKKEIIHSFNRPMNNRKQSNALAENVNGRLRELLHISHGYSNFDRFRCRAIYCLNDHIYYNLTSSLSPKFRKGKKRGKYIKHNK